MKKNCITLLVFLVSITFFSTASFAAEKLLTAKQLAAEKAAATKKEASAETDKNPIPTLKEAAKAKEAIASQPATKQDIAKLYLAIKKEIKASQAANKKETDWLSVRQKWLFRTIKGQGKTNQELIKDASVTTIQTLGKRIASIEKEIDDAFTGDKKKTSSLKSNKKP